MFADLEDIAQRCCMHYALDKEAINGYRAVALTFVTHLDTYLDNKQSFLGYFGQPVKRDGEPVRVPDIVPVRIIPFINAPLGNLFGTVAIKNGYSAEIVHKPLIAREGGSLNPFVDLTTRQTLYAKINLSAGCIQTVELAKICPHSDPTQMTVVLTGFYVLPN